MVSKRIKFVGRKPRVLSRLTRAEELDALNFVPTTSTLSSGLKVSLCFFRRNSGQSFLASFFPSLSGMVSFHESEFVTASRTCLWWFSCA